MYNAAHNEQTELKIQFYYQKWGTMGNILYILGNPIRRPDLSLPPILLLSLSHHSKSILSYQKKVCGISAETGLIFTQQYYVKITDMCRVLKQISCFYTRIHRAFEPLDLITRLPSFGSNNLHRTFLITVVQTYTMVRRNHFLHHCSLQNCFSSAIFLGCLVWIALLRSCQNISIGQDSSWGCSFCRSYSVLGGLRASWNCLGLKYKPISKF